MLDEGNKMGIATASVVADDDLSLGTNLSLADGAVKDSYSESVDEIKGYMNRMRMSTDRRLGYWLNVWEEWMSKGLDTAGVELEIGRCKEAMMFRLQTKQWQVDYMRENGECDRALKGYRGGKMGDANRRPMEYNGKTGDVACEKMNNGYYLKVGGVENRMLGQLLEDMEQGLVKGGYIFPQEGASLKVVMGYRGGDEVNDRPVKWQGTLAELHEMIRYLIDDLRVMDCPSGYNIRWSIAVNCFVDRQGEAIKLRSLSRSSGIKADDAERLHRCVPRFDRMARR